jgi:hypothetical protein
MEFIAFFLSLGRERWTFRTCGYAEKRYNFFGSIY